MMNEPSLFDDLTHCLGRWERRRFWSDVLLWLPRGLLTGLVAAAVIAALSRFRPVFHNREVALIAVGMALLGCIISVLALSLRRRSLLDQARYFDSYLGLQERISASVEIHAGRLPTPPSLAREQLADAALAVAGVDIRRRIPLRPHWPDLAMNFLASLLLLLAVILPNSLSAVLDEQQAVAESIAEQVTALEALEQRIQGESSLVDADRQELLTPIEGALQELNGGELTREEAVAVISQAEAELRELAELSDAESLNLALNEAGRTLAENPLTQALGQSLMAGQLAQASSALNQLADSLAGSSTAESGDLGQTAAALQEVAPALASQLAEAGQALQSGDVESAQQALREAAATTQQRAMEQAAGAQAQAAAEQLRSAREQVASAGASVNGATTADGQSTKGEGSGRGQGSQAQGNGQGNSQGQGSFSEEGQGAGGPGPGGGHAESVFVPDYADL
ncbi:MAG: hypothetical protein JSW55_16950, partial [Chloroflexota bacterium]